MKKISLKKKIQVWDLIGALIPHLCFFFWNKKKFIFEKITSVGLSAFQKNLQVLILPLVIFFRKSLGHSQIKKKSRQKWLSPKLTLRKDLYMDTAKKMTKQKLRTYETVIFSKRNLKITLFFRFYLLLIPFWRNLFINSFALSLLLQWQSVW